MANPFAPIRNPKRNQFLKFLISHTSTSPYLPLPPPTKSPGKTTLASRITTTLNDRYAQSSPALGSNSSAPLAAFIPMDGYHLTRAQLDALPDPQTAHARRGAAFTFDGPGFLALVEALRAPLCPESRTVYAPSFDHRVKDPVADDIAVSPSSRVVVFEGNYIALDKGSWREARALMDEVWFVEVEEGIARRRLVARHVKAGIARDEEEAAQRVEENDLLNGREILACRGAVDEVVKSVEDGAWTPEAQGGEVVLNGVNGVNRANIEGL